MQRYWSSSFQVTVTLVQVVALFWLEAFFSGDISWSDMLTLIFKLGMTTFMQIDLLLFTTLLFEVYQYWQESVNKDWDDKHIFFVIFIIYCVCAVVKIEPYLTNTVLWLRRRCALDSRYNFMRQNRDDLDNLQKAEREAFARFKEQPTDENREDLLE